MRHTSRHAALLDNPLFWATYYHELLPTEEADNADCIEPYFGVSATAVNQFFLDELCVRRFAEPSGSAMPWVSIAIDLPENFMLQIVFADDSEYEERYLLQHPTWSEPELLGYASGSFALPALRWREVVQSATCCFDPMGSLRPSPTALALLFPAIWITPADDYNEIYATLAAAWRALGIVRAAAIESFVTQIMAHNAIDVRWRYDQTLGWINDSLYSLRNPNTRMRPFDAQHFARLEQFRHLLERQVSGA